MNLKAKRQFPASVVWAHFMHAYVAEINKKRQTQDLLSSASSHGVDWQLEFVVDRHSECGLMTTNSGVSGVSCHRVIVALCDVAMWW
jgi:hypothetical protein